MSENTNSVENINKVESGASELTAEQQFLAERERDIRKKHRRVLPGTIRREVEGVHAGKLTVEMKCQTDGCKNTRRVATSDLHQVRFCTLCTVEIRNRRRRSKAKAARKDKAGEGEAVGTAVKKSRKKAARAAKVESPDLVGAGEGGSDDKNGFQHLPTTSVEAVASEA